MDNNVGRTIETLREQRMLTKRGLAAEAGVSPSAVSRTERGITRPTPRVLRGIVQVGLRVELDDFWDMVYQR